MTENKMILGETKEEVKSSDIPSTVEKSEPAPKQKRGRKKSVDDSAYTVHADLAEQESTNPVEKSSLKPGKMYSNPDGIRLYASCVATQPVYRYMGSVALWSDDTINDRVRITDTCIHAGIHSKLIGWVNVNELGDDIHG